MRTLCAVGVLVAAVLVNAAVGASGPLVAAGDFVHAPPGSLSSRPLGLVPPEPQAWARLAQESAPAVSRLRGRRDIPPPAAARVDFDYLPAIGYQSYGNCGAWPAAYYIKTYQEAKEHGWIRPDPAVDPEHVASVAFPYSLEYIPSLQGSSPDYIANVLKYHGTTSWLERPESSGYGAPGVSEWRHAAPRRISDWHALDLSGAGGRDVAKGLVASGYPLVTGWAKTTGNIDAYAGGDADGISNDVLYRYSTWGDPGRIGVGHAVTIVGYDDAKAYSADGDPKSGAWLVANQWGTGWGVAAEPGGPRGYMWIAYEMLSWGQVLEDRAGYQPRDFFVYDVQADIPGYADLSLLYGDPASPTLTMDLFRVHSMNSWITTVAEDITDYHNQLSGQWNWRLSLTSVSATNAGAVRWAPAVTSATLELEGRSPLRFSGLPLTGVSMQTVSLDQPPNLRQPADSALNAITYGDVAWTDWNRDGREDLFLANSGSYAAWVNGVDTPAANVVLISRGDGTFERLETGIPFCWTPVVADFDRNGRPDLLVTDDSCALTLHLQDHSGGMAPCPDALPPRCSASMAGADFDNDGDTDVLLYGWTTDPGNSVLSTQLWLNDGAAGFNNSGILFPDTFTPPFHLHDLNADGWIDIIAANTLYRNDAGTSFTSMGDLPAAQHSLAFGDRDADGLVDLALLASGETLILRNNGDFTFTQERSLPGFVAYSTEPRSALWADFDADGRLDLLQSGFVSFGGDFTRVPREVRFHRQLADGSFDRPGVVFPPLAQGVVTAGDVDGDGAVDLLVSGSRTTPYPEPAPSRLPWEAAWYLNGLPEMAAIPHNTPPAAPGGLAATVINAQAGDVDLSWSPADDAEEQGNLALGYRVRVGTTPGGDQVLSDASPHELQGLWLTPGHPGRHLRALPRGHYYWSVRAVDSSLVPGPWSQEFLFDVGVTGTPGDINRDGTCDAADVRSLQRVLGGQSATDLVAADMDANGRIDAEDVGGIAARIVAGNWVVGTIGSEGGSLEGPGIRLRVPPGALDQSVSLSIERATQNPMADGSNRTGWLIHGLPDGFSETLAIELQGDPTLTVLRSEQGFRKSLGSIVTAWRPIPSLPLGSGWVRVSLPPMPPSPDRTSQRASVEGGTLGLDLAEVTLTTTPRWRITLPPAYLPQYNRVVAALDAAYDKFSQPPYGFSYSGRTSWPMDVFFRPLADDGGNVSSKWGIDYSYIELNTKFLQYPDGNGSDPSLECVVGHEFFHFVQTLYDPRSSLSIATLCGYQYWIDEMTAAWAETLFTSDPGYIPSVTSLYKDAPLAGLPRADLSFYATQTKTMAHWGYGLAPLCKFLVQRYGPAFLLSTYQKIRGGMMPIPALSTSLWSGAPNNQLWWGEFAANWIDDEKLFNYNGHLLLPIPNQEFPTFPGSDQRLYFTKSTDLAKHFVPAVAPYGISGFLVSPMNPAYSVLQAPGTEVMFRLKDTSHELGLAVTVLDTQVPSTTYTPARLSLDVWRVDVPNAATLAQNNSYIAAAVTDTAGTSTHRPDVDIYVLYTGDQEVLPVTIGQLQIDGTKFPRYTVTGTLHVQKTGALERSDVSGYQSATIGIPWLTQTQTFPLSLQFTLVSGSTHSYTFDGYDYELSISGTPGYRLFRRNREYTNVYLAEDHATPEFSLTMDPTKNYQLYDVAIRVPIHERQFDTGHVLVQEHDEIYEIGGYSAIMLMGDHNWEENEETPYVP